MNDLQNEKDAVMYALQHAPDEVLAIAPSISSAAMIVDFNASVWTARKKDHKASEQVNYVNNADKGVANVSKNLLGNCPELQAIQKFVGNLRNMHYGMTMPWSDNGSRLVTTAAYFDYNEVMTGLIAEGWDLVKSFGEVYPYLTAGAQAQMGGLFNANEYPPLEQVMQKLSFRLNYTPLPEAGDFRIDIGNEAMQQIKSQYSEHFTTQIKGAMNDLWQRLHDNLTTLVRQLEVDEEGKGNRLYQTVFDQCLALVKMLGTCNITQDSHMEAVRRKLEEALHGTNIEQLKTNHTFREETRTKLTAAIAALPSLDM